MIDATALGGVVGDGAAGSSELVVESDAGCEREESCGDAGAEVVGSSGAVAFEPDRREPAQELRAGQRAELSA